MKVNGKKLLQYRKENGLSREELAEKLDLTSKTIQRIENGESTKESTVELIKNCLGLDIEIKDEFTTEQLKAINSDSKHLKVLAGAGAGKTRVAEEVIAKRMQARTASGYIYEYDEKMCKYTERERWKPYNKEEVVFSIDFTNLSQFFNCQYGFRLSQIYGFVNPINLRMGYGASIHSMAI